MSIQTTPSIYTVISKSNPTGVYSSLPNSYITNLVYNPSVRPLNPVKGEQYLDSTDNTLYYWNGSSWVSGGGSLPPGTYYGDYLYWNGYNYVVGSNNVNLGANSGEKAQGSYNVAIGYQAGFTGGFSSEDPFASSATGSSVAIGYYAGYEQSCNSIAIGNNAGYYQEFNNIAIGSSAGYYQSEINNIAIGIAAGAYNQGTGGSQNSVGGNSIAIGSTVGNNLQGYESVAIGFYAAGNKQGYNSIAIGTNTANTLQGNTSIAMGLNAGETSQGNTSIAMGLNAGSSSQGNYSVAIGRNTASSNQGIDSLALGSYAGNTSQGGNTVALGYYAGYNLQEDYSVAIGNSAGLDNQRQRSVAIGNGAGRNTQQYSAIAIGDNAGYTNQQDNCIAIGSLAGNINQGVTGDPINGQAIAIGYRAAENNQGDQSISIGTRAGNYNQHDYGIAIGHYAGATEQSTGCVAIGVGAGSYQQGEYSIALGYNAGSINQEKESIIINASSSTGINASTGGLFINPVREGSSSQVLFYNPSSKEITYSTGGSIGSGGGFIQMVQLLDNVQATAGIISGQSIIPNWTFPFTSNGGKLMFTTSFTSYSTIQGLYTFDFLIDGNVVANSKFYFNNTSIHHTIPSLFNIENISAGSHTGAIRIPSGVTVDSQDYCNASLIEVLGANSIGLTGPTGANGLSNIGKDSQVLFNYEGSSTGSNNLSYTGGNLINNGPITIGNRLYTTTDNPTNGMSWLGLKNGSEPSNLAIGFGNTGTTSVIDNIRFLTFGNEAMKVTNNGYVGIGTSNPSYLLHVNGNISPYTINRGNPGKNNTLLLDSFNTTHFYSINASTGFIDISTQMLENAIYEVNFSVSSCSAANDDMSLYPNCTGGYGGSTFYTAYQQTSSVPALQYTTSINPYFMFDMVNGSIGWDPVGKITIYNNRSAKKIVFTGGDTTSPVHGQGYWTNNTGFTSTSGTSPVYDTTTVWSTVGRLQFGTPLSSNWAVWVKRVM